MRIMTDSPIRFPGLFGDWEFTASSTAFHVGGKAIYWYGILIALGVVLALWFCMTQKEKYGITEDDLLDAVLWGVPLSVVGARVYYVIFYLDLFKKSDGSFDWGSAVAIWDGGLAIYGAVIAAILVGVVLCRKKGMKLGALTDLVVMGFLIGQTVGRWGNFMNREAFGAETDVFCRMGLISPDGTTIYVHPTFLYESLWNLVCLIFLAVWVKAGKRRYDGQCILIYFFWYGIGRAWIEGLRTDSLYIGSTGIRVSQALSMALALISFILLVVNARRQHKPEELYVNRVASSAAASESPAEETESNKEE